MVDNTRTTSNHSDGSRSPKVDNYSENRVLVITKRSFSNPSEGVSVFLNPIKINVKKFKFITDFIIRKKENCKLV